MDQLPSFKIKVKKKKLQACIVDRLSTAPSQTTVTDRSKLKMTESMIWCEWKKGRNSVDGVLKEHYYDTWNLGRE